jgi:hypothetical protein
MCPKPHQKAAKQHLFRVELVKLAARIDWPALEEAWDPKFESTTGRPALHTRWMASLLHLKPTKRCRTRMWSAGGSRARTGNTSAEGAGSAMSLPATR